MKNLKYIVTLFKFINYDGKKMNILIVNFMKTNPPIKNINLNWFIPFKGGINYSSTN